MSTCLNVLIYSVYGLLFLFSQVSKPLGEENISNTKMIVMLLVFILLPISVLWLSRRYDITTFSDGYSKTSEVFFCLLLIPFNLILLKIYHKQFLPVL